jgi:hypothetical protein
MTTRHRIPTIFNLSMVDVLCCALGCVILLWLLNLREAKQRAVAAGQATEQLAQTRLLLGSTTSQLKDTEGKRQAAESLLRETSAERDRLSQRAAAAEAESKTTAETLAATRTRAAELDKSLSALRQSLADAQDRLTKKSKERDTLAADLVSARQHVSELDVLVREKDAQARATAHSADELAQRLRDLDAQAKDLRTRAEQVPALRDEADKTRERLAGTQARVRKLEQDVEERDRELAGAGRTIAGLQNERSDLATQALRAREAMENRFAGITLTGRRVVFLVDMSGSMELVDENTTAPEKWTGVRQTLAKVMRSLPDLEKFQVILFSNQVSYPLGNDGFWLDFDAVTSTSRVAQALAAIKPKGNTDMYAAFEAAFRFRNLGLDTIYVLSDGLPNIGVGLSPEQARVLKETERSEILSRYMRQMLRTQWNRAGAGQPLVRINTIGFFYESPDVGAFLWALARENDGSFVGMSKP